MLIIGLTGGIGSGKSTVAGYFAQLGIPVIDTDQLARELVVAGSPALKEITEAFGPEILLPDGSLNRARLKRRVFSDSVQRRRLEGILHPRIYTELQHRSQSLRAPYCVWVIPLLLESGATARVHRVLVIDTPEALQRQRVLERDGMDEDTLAGILRSQVSRNERLQAADDIIVNDADLAHLQQQVITLHHRYLGLASTPPSPPEK